MLECTTYTGKFTMAKAQMTSQELIGNAKKFLHQKNVLEKAPEHLLDDKTTMLKLNEFMYGVAEYASKRLQADKDFMLQMVKKDGYALRYASDALRDDDEIVYAALENQGRSLFHASERFKQNREVVLKAVKQKGCGDVIYALSDKFKDDTEIVFEAIKSSGPRVLSYVSERLQNDEQIAKEVIATDFQHFAYLGEIIRAHRELALQVAKIHHMGCGYVAKSLRADKAFMLEVLDSQPTSIIYASDELKADKDMLRKGYIDQDLLSYAVNLRDDKDFLLELHAKNRFLNLEHLSPRLKDDKDFFMKLMDMNPRSITYASERLQNDIDLVNKIEFHQSCYSQLQDIGETLRNRRDIAIKGITVDGRGLKFLNESLRKDKEIVLLAVSNYGEALKYADKSLQKNKEIVQAATDNNPVALKYASKTLRNDKAFVLSVLKKATEYQRSCVVSYCIGQALSTEMGTNAPIKYLTQALKEQRENSSAALTPKKKVKP